MSFFEIKDPNYNSDQIEAEIFSYLSSKKIPLEQENKFFEKYNQKMLPLKKRWYFPFTPFKVYFNNLLRWNLRINYGHHHPNFFLERWSEQIKRDLADIAIKNHVKDNLEPRYQLEYLLYERFLLIKEVEGVEKENAEMSAMIDMIHQTFSWRITVPLRILKRILRPLFSKDS